MIIFCDVSLQDIGESEMIINLSATSCPCTKLGLDLSRRQRVSRHEKCKNNETTQIVERKSRLHLHRTSQILAFRDVFEDVAKSLVYLTEFIRQFSHNSFTIQIFEREREKVRGCQISSLSLPSLAAALPTAVLKSIALEVFYFIFM